MVVVAVLAALVVGVIALVAFADLAGGSTWPFGGASTPNIDASKWYDVTRSAIAVVGLAGLGGGAIIAYRRQQTAERRQTIEEARHRTEAARQRTEEARSSLERDRHEFEVEKRRDSDIADLRARYAKAAEQLGHSKAAVRLAGVYAMAALADDWLTAGNDQQQKVCVDVLCAYLRMPYDPESADVGEKEVRLTIFSVIRDKMQDPELATSWCDLTLDFTGAVIDGGTLSGVTTSGQMVFDRAKFIGDFRLEGSKVVSGKVSFQNAAFFGGRVSFRRASIQGGLLSFDAARFSGGDLSFSGAQLSGGKITFSRTAITAGRIGFDEVVMSGGDISVSFPKFEGGLMTFNEAELVGGKCRVDGWGFRRGKVQFHQAKFLGTDVDLRGIHVQEDGNFVLDLSSPRLWTFPPKVPGAYDAQNPWGSDAETSGPASYVLPQAWPPAEETLPF
jgi:uncharacterized protein YjbI with pentapeptide repeats